MTPAARVQMVWHNASRKLLSEFVRHSHLGPVVSAAALPIALLDVLAGLENPWTVALERAKVGRLKQAQCVLFTLQRNAGSLD